jgi:hypothetical protein
MEGVVPSDWMEAKDGRLIKAPGYWKIDKSVSRFVYYEAPIGAPFNAVMLERARLRTEFSMKGSGKNTLPAIISFKFGMMNVGSATVDRMNISKMATTRPGVGVKDTMIPAGYKSFPEVAMTRFDQERGERLDEKRVVIPRDVDSTLPVRQAMSAPTIARQEAPNTVSIHPAKEEEIVRKELNRIQAAQDSPTSLAGVIRALHMVNAPAKKLAVVSRLPQGVQSRLGTRRVSNTSVELEEVEKIPERGGERGTTSRTTARSDSPTSSVSHPILTDSAEESDNEDMEKIRDQRYRIKMEREKLKMETDRLERMEKRHAKERRLRK